MGMNEISAACTITAKQRSRGQNKGEEAVSTLLFSTSDLVFIWQFSAAERPLRVGR